METITANTIHAELKAALAASGGDVTDGILEVFHRFLRICLCSLNTGCRDEFTHRVGPAFPWTHTPPVVSVSETQDGMVFFDLSDGSDLQDEACPADMILPVSDYFLSLVDGTACGALLLEPARRRPDVRDFSPGVMSVVSHEDLPDGRVATTELKECVEVILCDRRLGRDEVPEGFHMMQVRGWDWSADISGPYLVALCEENREALRHHLTDEEYKTLKGPAVEDECSDEYYKLRTELNNALLDQDKPTVEGFFETLEKGVLCDFWETVLMKQDPDALRRECGLDEDATMFVETGTADRAESGLWEQFERQLTK